MKTLEPQGEAKSPRNHRTTETEWNHIRKVRVALCSGPMVAPAPGLPSAKLLRGPPGPVVFLVGKRAQRGYPASPVLRDASQETHSGLASSASLGTPVGLNHWGSDTDREGSGCRKPALMSWQASSCLCDTGAEILAHLQSEVSGPFWPSCQM